MRALALLAMLVSGCAVGRITPRGELVGFAVGHAKLEYCEPGPVPDSKPTCRRLEGGSLSSGFADFLSTAVTAVGAYFGFGG